MTVSPTLTLCHDGSQGDREYVVACRGRPFAILTSPKFPTPASTLVDFALVRDLKLQMTELQCAKFHYAGQKLRILGKVSTSVQCIQNGAPAGSMHLKATVVQDLYQIFDTHSIAGSKLSEKLLGPPFQLYPEDSPTEPTTPKKQRTKKRKASPSFPTSHGSSPCSSQNLSLSASPTERTPRTTPLSSPPGFPSPISPVMATVPASLPSQTNILGLSPLSININRLTATFGAADLAEDLHVQQALLKEADPDGLLEMGNSRRSFNFYKSRAVTAPPSETHGPVFNTGHGRRSCNYICRNIGDFPHNCGHHPQWQLPHGFQLCGPQCKGGLCPCLTEYSDYGYYG